MVQIEMKYGLLRAFWTQYYIPYGSLRFEFLQFFAQIAKIQYEDESEEVSSEQRIIFSCSNYVQYMLKNLAQD